MKGSDPMAQTLINIRIDEDLKKSFESVCQDLGINTTTAFTIFAKKMAREQRIPFDVSIDPFYSEANMTRLRKSIDGVTSGKSSLTAHELIEVEDE